jgi:hypothetical protein
VKPFRGTLISLGAIGFLIVLSCSNHSTPPKIAGNKYEIAEELFREDACFTKPKWKSVNPYWGKRFNLLMNMRKYHLNHQV